MSTIKRIRLTSTVLVAFTTTAFEVNKNGDKPLWAKYIAGEAPDGVNILDGSIAARAGIEPNKTYLCQLEVTDPTDGYEYPNLNFTVLGTPTMMEVLQAQQMLGKVKPVKVMDAVPSTNKVDDTVAEEDDIEDLEEEIVVPATPSKQAPKGKK